MRRNDRSIAAVPRLIAAPALVLALALTAAAEEWWSGSECCLHGKLEHHGLAGLNDAAWDEPSGRDERNFPPDRLVDYRHMTLYLRFDNLDDRAFTATQTLRFEPIGGPVDALRLDAVALRIDSVKLDGAPAEHFADGEQIGLRFDPPLVPGAAHELTIEYACEQPWDGMFFTPSSPDAPHYSPEVHTQGQSESNRHWFPCHDFPNERMSTELIVDVPADFAVSSNGRLVAHEVSGDRAVWHWLQEKPHVAYLVSLVVGRFDRVDIPHERVPMTVWVPVGLGDRVMQTYGRTGAMLDLFERRFGVAYPWDRYDQLVLKNFNAGGMENTSATSMYPTALLDETALLDGDIESLIAHELCHQWTGDLITCRSWEHIWLNEGWATFGSALWFEQRDGIDGYLDNIRRQHRVAHRDRTSDEIPMVSPIYGQSRETFRRRANPYPKGASILHMLRSMLGEEIFWGGVQRYMQRHAGGLVETSDFRYALEEASGLGLEWFFEQWCERPGCPNLEAQVHYDPPERRLRVDLAQMQQIDSRTPAFRFTLPVHVITAAGEQVVEMNVDERTASLDVELEGPPLVVAIDPYLHVLKTIEVEKAPALWTEQATRGPTIAARHAALDALGELDRPEHVRLLAAIARDEAERHTLRESAIDALRACTSPEAKQALLAILKDDVADARVRAEVVEAARDLDRAEVLEVLALRASEDPSYATRVAAIGALAHHEAGEHADLIAGLVHFDSQHQQVRSAALRALAALDDPRGLELGIEYAAYGHLDRARPVAVGVIGDLAEHDADRAVPLLIDLLDDPERRTRHAALRALAETGDERAEAPLRGIARSHADPRFREMAEEALEQGEEEDGERRGGRGSE